MIFEKNGTFEKFGVVGNSGKKRQKTTEALIFKTKTGHSEQIGGSCNFRKTRIIRKNVNSHKQTGHLKKIGGSCKFRKTLIIRKTLIFEKDGTFDKMRPHLQNNDDNDNKNYSKNYPPPGLHCPVEWNRL